MALVCPECKVALRRASIAEGIVYPCPRCGGRAVTFSVLRKYAHDDFMKKLWHLANGPEARVGDKCPNCQRGMAAVDFPVGAKSLTLETCPHCQVVWLSAGELQQIPHDVLAAAAPPPVPFRAPAAKTQPPPLPPGIERKASQPQEEESAWPREGWQWIPAMMGLPVETQGPKTTRPAVLTWLMAIVTALLFVSLVTQGKLEGTIKDYGFVPSHWLRHEGWTLLTSFFLHASWWHVASNLYFFVVFGRSVEGNLGAFKYLLLIAAAHLMGMTLHGLYEPRADLPTVGASAGISGIIAYYGITFPTARLGIMLRIFILFGPMIHISAFIALLLFALMQVLGTIAQVGGFTDVSYLGHLGGLAVGILAAIIAKAREKESDYRNAVAHLPA